ncbi:hypothetical protein GCM10027447_20290 [Glycomyces halotolerans]
MGPALPQTRKSRRSLIAAVSAAAIAAGGAAITMTAASAQTAGCEVDYQVTNEWPGGFNADVVITNLGAPVDGWNLEWDFRDGQQVQNAWNAQVQQSGAHVSAVDAGYNGAIAGGASVGFGFTGTFDMAAGNTEPASFALNGTACTGQSQPPEPTEPEPTDPGDGEPYEWNPPAHLAQPLQEVWNHVEDTYDLDFRNFGWDQIMATGGKINYCVRWDSRQPVSAALRDGIEAKVQEQYQLWFDQMAGWNDWPFDEIDVEVVGWAAYDRDLLQWSDDSVDVYIGDIREDAPQCVEDCGRFFHRDGAYPNCPGGYDHHYDQSLWLTEGMGGGAGGDWGQRMGSEYFVDSLNADHVTIYLHEVGHTFGLDDFYDWTPTGQCCFIMKAGSSSTITEFDEWMLRDWWRHLKGRYGL